MDGEKFARMIRRAAAMLAESKEEIDALNVFPVPDGDTGANMYLTMASAVKEVENIMPAPPGALAEAAARGSLMGARGNSGVILSQLMRGIAKGLNKTGKVTPAAFAEALHNGTEVAYRAVMKPVEGTILTVARGASQAAKNAAKNNKSMEDVLAAALDGARNALAETPKLLPVLAQSGVVDAGGKGWEMIMAGFLAGAAENQMDSGQPGPLPKPPEKSSEMPPELPENPKRPLSSRSEGLEFKYCTELLVKGRNLHTDTIRDRLSVLGDSLLVVGTEDTVKVHVHTNQPGRVLEICLEYGDLYQIKVDNMARQQQEKMPAEVIKPLGTVTVAAGSGLEEILLSLGADEVISGGQTMNPCAEEIARAVDRVPAENVIILPNNSNIILTAQLVGKLTNKNTTVIPARSIQQGIAAMLALAPDRDVAENVLLMREGMQHVISGEVTFAVRDSEYNGGKIKKGDILGIIDDEIRRVGQDINAVTLDLIQSVLDESREIITVYYGEEVTAEQARVLEKAIGEKWPHLETEVHFGGQPLYYYLFSVE